MPSQKKNRGSCVICGGNVFAAHKGTQTCSPDCGYELRGRIARGEGPPPTPPFAGPGPGSWQGIPSSHPTPEVPLPAGRPWNDERNRKKVGVSPVRVGVFDIETTGLNASFGRVLCAVVKTYDPLTTKIFRADEYDGWNEGRRASDFGLVSAILAYIEDIDVLIGHNAVNFDAPFLRTRALIHGLPAVQPLKIYDPCLQARKQFRFHRNSLSAISEVLETAERKTPLLPTIWQKAIGDGDKACLDQIVEHCVADVDTLEEVAWSMRKYVKALDQLGSWR